MADPEAMSSTGGGAVGDAVRRLALTWSIPDGFGGMTSAMLHRSRAIAEATGGVVDVLTFDPRAGYDDVRARLTEQGELTARVRLRNLYEELAVRAGGAPAVEVRELRTASDELARVEHRRADGSLAVLDERVGATGGRRRITVFDADQTPAGEWLGAWACYAAWLDRLVADSPTVAVVDSKSMAPFVAQLSRPNLATVHVVHASHLSGTARPYAPLRASRATALARLERFDAVVFLTERQRDDAVRLLDDPGNLTVIPNGRPLPGAIPDDGHRSGGVVVAALTERKRVDEAIAIAELAAPRVPGGTASATSATSATLTIVGDGPDRTRLETLAAASGCGVDFAGYRPDGAEAFADASWMLLTSRSEGSPLVLIEAMARGCVPVAYDVPYGPADLIEHGVNGFLVGDGDRLAAADAIISLGSAPPSARAALRDAARRTAERFDDAVVTRAWLDLERAVLARAATGSRAIHAGTLDRVRLRLRRGVLRLRAELPHAGEASQVVASFRVVGTTRIVRRRVRPHSDGRVRLRLDPEATALLAGRGRIEVSLQVIDGRAHAEPPAVRLHPDRRGLPRRVYDRLARLVRFDRHRRSRLARPDG